MSIYLEIDRLTHVRFANISSMIYVFAWYTVFARQPNWNIPWCQLRGKGDNKKVYIYAPRVKSGQCSHVSQTGFYVLYYEVTLEECTYTLYISTPPRWKQIHRRVTSQHLICWYPMYSTLHPSGHEKKIEFQLAFGTSSCKILLAQGKSQFALRPFIIQFADNLPYPFALGR